MSKGDQVKVFFAAGGGGKCQEKSTRHKAVCFVISNFLHAMVQAAAKKC